jgi:F0F1-type ATP synthase membrane subunit b/b'
MLSEVQEEIVGLVVQTTSKVLKRELSERDRTSYSESAARELAEVE